MTSIATFLEETIVGAGEVTLRYFNNAALRVSEKSDRSPVTIADREAETFLRDRISKAFPDDGILGEEFGETSGTSGRRWILDPLDGTKSFICGVPLYGSLVALEEDGEVTHGAIYMPALRELVIAERDKGCRFNGIECHVSETASLDDAVVTTTSPIRLETLLGAERYRDLANRAKIFRGWGDCYGHLLVATGRVDAMLDPLMAPWDSAPMGVVISEAGGWSSDFSGAHTVKSSNLLSTTCPLSTEILRYTGMLQR